MSTPNRIAALALACGIAAPAEGLRQWAYRDPVGIPTICMGSTRGVRMGDHKTVAECRALLSREMLERIDAVERCAPGLPAHQLAAFADLAYNLGERAVCDPSYSTLARKLKQGDPLAACAQLPRWDKARIAGVPVTLPGLTKRRAAERELCERGVT
jgi:lysozyme